MMSQYQDKSTEFAAYRMLLAGVSVAVDLLIVLLTAIAVPRISAYAMCALCLAVIVLTLAFQIRIDHTLIFTGQFLVEDGKALYAVIGTFGLGFGKRHRQKRKINSYRFYYLDRVEKVDNRPFGIRVKADVYTATTGSVNVDKEIFNNPGAMKKLLMEQGKKRSTVFRIEHNLTDREEKRLLQKLDCLK
ncbi:MAG: hypothetical protein Q4C77_01210 [Eubacteriales bacterium]|nr:hypothetical protein [Eubacteriales bacterium]